MRKILSSTLLAMALSVAAGQAQAYGEGAYNGPEQRCYGVAMVGFDSVINSRMGVPAEHALDLANAHHFPAPSDAVYGGDLYGTYLLKVILSAYLWEENPHSYAVKVFYQCARDQRQMQQARND